jgi:hypothetical protein
LFRADDRRAAIARRERLESIPFARSCPASENVETTTTNHLLDSGSAFHADDTEQVAHYRTVSALAVVSLAFGAASLLCIAWPLFLAVPLFGAAVSIVALRRIELSDGALAGRWAATAGLALCVASGTAVLSRDLVTRYVRVRQAEGLAREWIELLVAGQAEKAFQLTVAANRRETAIPEPGMPDRTETPKELFISDPIVARLVAAGTDAAVQFAGTLRYEAQPHRQFMVEQEFLVTPATASDKPDRSPIEFAVTLQRSRVIGERHPRWLVRSHEAPPTTAAGGSQ